MNDASNVLVMRDAVTGRQDRRNPLNKKRLSRFELDRLFIEMCEW